MRSYIQQVVYRVQGSYWFIPSLMVIAAIILSQLAIWIDHRYGNAWLKEMWLIALNQPDGARAILATVAGSMITVAGVTFSLTTLAVSHASSQFGPRLLDNFMHDRGNQITLGTFVATFIYCLLVLRVVRGEDVVAMDGLAVSVFVPQLSLFLALVLTMGSVVVLIYFIHHVPNSIHITSLLQRLATDMRNYLDKLFPEELGTGATAPELALQVTFQAEHSIYSISHGYIQGIDEVELIEFAQERGVMIQLLRRPGDFVRQGECIAEISNCDEWKEKDASRVHRSVTIGFGRTPTQDAFYVLNEFIEVAVRALSPGVNDPFTAMQCIDWLSAGIVQLSKKELPNRYRADSEGEVRIITAEITYKQFVDAMLWQLVPYVKTDVNTLEYMRTSLARTIDISERAELNSLISDVMRELKHA
ncbi:DUF2254 domain-containing protein [Planctomycetaceae bacterium SH139]